MENFKSGVNANITNNGSSIDIDLSPARSWEEITADLTPHEIELLDCLYCLSRHQSKLIDDRVINLAVTLGYTYDECVTLCEKMDEEKDLIMDMSWVNDDWEGSWMDSDYEWMLITDDRMKIDGCYGQDECEYLANKYGKPEWLVACSKLDNSKPQ